MDRALRILVKLSNYFTAEHCCSCHISNQQEDNMRPHHFSSFMFSGLISLITVPSPMKMGFHCMPLTFCKSCVLFMCIILYLTHHTIVKYSIVNLYNKHESVCDVARQKVSPISQLSVKFAQLFINCTLHFLAQSYWQQGNVQNESLTSEKSIHFLPLYPCWCRGERQITIHTSDGLAIGQCG